ncbi:MAG TPA: prolipoprotein diacylglyceryl transferase [Chryseolinea sp.]|nr:prolipoprotein diacylglyceryl transferase [Chryseolinea sp.]HPM31848.1 prolipoprotein diacylglyceryl transferase [Chryseolinea sp.]
MATPQWLERLKQHWHLQSIVQVIVVLIVFACTGFTVLFIKKPVLAFLAGEEGKSTLASVLYYIFILPLYNLILLGYGFLFGQFAFFWEFEKRFFHKLISWSRKRKV